MARIKRPRKRFHTVGRASRRFIWWWIQNKNGFEPDDRGFLFDTSIWFDTTRWKDNDNWMD